MRRTLTTLAGLLVPLFLGTPAADAGPADGIVDLRTYPHLEIEGVPFNHGAGASVSGAGDFNGDGVPDVVIGQDDVDLPDRSTAGAAFVVFGDASSGRIELESPGSRGFQISGAAAFDLAGYSVSGAGDVNGDGLDDVIVGAPGADAHGRSGSGSAWVVFGKAGTAPVDLAALGTRGFRIDGGATGDSDSSFGTRFAVSGAGDVNSDGLDDVIVGTGFADRNGRTDSGSFYVVFGKQSTDEIDLAALGSQGFRIDGAVTGERFAGRISASDAGDVNGDGLDDVLVGLDFVSSFAGAAYVVFGKRTTETADLAALGSQGFTIEGFRVAAAGNSVSGAGDLDRDGLDDVVVGAQTVDLPGKPDAGAAYVVFGKSSTETVQLASLGASGFRIAGESAGDLLGSSVSGAGDVSGDGVPDLLLGATLAQYNGGNDNWHSGSAYVFYGKGDSTPVDLANPVRRGFRIDGDDIQSGLGWSVSDLGDMDGDGRADVLAGGPDINSSFDAGSAHVVFSGGLPASVEITPPDATNTVEQEHCVTATVRDANGVVAAGVDVRFSVTGGAAGGSGQGSGTTGGDGTATFCYTGPSLGPSTDTITAFADVDRDGAHTAGEPSGEATKLWTAPASTAGCRVTTRGHIRTLAGTKATFSGGASVRAGGPSGRFDYVEHGSTPRLRIRSSIVNALTCSGSAAKVFGEARINGASTLFRIDVSDGSRDTYRIRTSSGYDSGDRPLAGGQITVRS